MVRWLPLCLLCPSLLTHERVTGEQPQHQPLQASRIKAKVMPRDNSGRSVGRSGAPTHNTHEVAAASETKTMLTRSHGVRSSERERSLYFSAACIAQPSIFPTFLRKMELLSRELEMHTCQRRGRCSPLYQKSITFTSISERT